MIIWNLIKRLSFRQLGVVSIVMIRRPLYIYPTIKATKKTLHICNSLFGDAHHGNGKSNSFRHALWNILICQNTFKLSRNEEKSIIWAKKITDLYEKLAPNSPINEVMDLHNNRLGRLWFKELKNVSEETIIVFLREKVNQANLIYKMEEADVFFNDLVYLSDSE